jgi:hypothetical protein
MLRTIEHHDDLVIQKVFTPKGKLIRYQAGKIGTLLTACSTLSEARAAIGVEIHPPAKVTAPKMSNPQNQKGYKAPNR